MECPTPCVCGEIVELADMRGIKGRLYDGGNLVCENCHCSACDGDGECGECGGTGEHWDGGLVCEVCSGRCICIDCNGLGYCLPDVDLDMLPELTDEEREALDSLGPDFVDRLLSGEIKAKDD